MDKYTGYIYSIKYYSALEKNDLANDLQGHRRPPTL